jgi:hypothetical protein
MLEHDARLDFFLEGQAGQLVGADRAVEIGEGLAHQQGLLLPIIAQEFASGNATQELKWNIRIHN